MPPNYPQHLDGPDLDGNGRLDALELELLTRNEQKNGPGCGPGCCLVLLLPLGIGLLAAAL